MKQKLLAVVLLLFIAVLAACGSEEDKQENAGTDLSFNASDLDISLYDTSENLVNVSPDGKTIYAYFTGVG